MDRIADRYELVQCIGRGGFGSVWLANDVALGREVAIKRLNVSDAGEPGSVSARRLEREAIATARLDHPNVVRVYDAGMLTETEEIYLVMERLTGRTLLEELATAGPIEPGRARELMVGALRGLHEAHGQGIVHKDLKPANLFIVDPGGPRETMKVIDFGIARMNSLDKLTRTGRMTGSPRYLAPEYIRESNVTARIDIYQIGLILAEMVSGKPCVPRGLQFVTACQRHVKGELEFDAEFIETPMGKLVRRATAREPDARFTTAAEFATALEEAPLPAQRYTLPQEKITAQWKGLAEKKPAAESKAPAQAPSPGSYQVSSETLWLVIAAAGGLALAAVVAVSTLVYVRYLNPANQDPPEPVAEFTPPGESPSSAVHEVVDLAAYDVETAVMLSRVKATEVGEEIVAKEEAKKKRGKGWD